MRKILNKLLLSGVVALNVMANGDGLAKTPKVVPAPVVRSSPRSDEVVALTFDDGPSQTFTPKVLDVMDAYHVRATFFVIGSRVKDQAAIIRREVAEGHEVANHSFHNLILTSVPAAKIADELDLTEAFLKKYVGIRTAKYLRPPRGRLNQRVIDIAAKHGYRVVLWRVDSRDWANPGVRVIVNHVITDVRSGDIVLFHDQGGSRVQTVTALKQVIPILQARGYRFVTLSEMLGNR